MNRRKKIKGLTYEQQLAMAVHVVYYVRQKMVSLWILLDEDEPKALTRVGHIIQSEQQLQHTFNVLRKFRVIEMTPSYISFDRSPAKEKEPQKKVSGQMDLAAFHKWLEFSKSPHRELGGVEAYLEKDEEPDDAHLPVFPPMTIGNKLSANVDLNEPE